MTTNRINGPSGPDPNRNQDSKINREASQRIEKVREVDPDEQARNRKRDQFKMMMDDTDDDTPTTSAPSPVDPKFYQSQANSSAMPEVDDAAVSSPGVSPPPNVNMMPDDSDLSDDDLPQSDQFWNNVGLPDQPVQPPVKPIQANTSGKPEAASGKEKKEIAIPGVVVSKDGKPAPKKESDVYFVPPGTKAPSGKEKTLEPSPFGPPGKSTPTKKGDNEVGTAPSGRYWTEDGRVDPVMGSQGTQKPNQKKSEKTSPHEIAAAKAEWENQLPQDTLDKKLSEEREKEKSGKGHSKEGATIASPTATPLPQDIQPYALAAATAASPYLRPEVIPLFYQMVGSIMIMSTPPGISRTEIVLNGAGFTNSKFYGAKIEITKYSTAPDSLNIRLTGSNEAVKSFNQNIPSLMASFQSGKFNFRIGRLDASYEADRPLIKRKKGSEETDADAGGETR